MAISAAAKTSKSAACVLDAGVTERFERICNQAIALSESCCGLTGSVMIMGIVEEKGGYFAAMDGSLKATYVPSTKKDSARGMLCIESFHKPVFIAELRDNVVTKIQAYETGMFSRWETRLNDEFSRLSYNGKLPALRTSSTD